MQKLWKQESLVVGGVVVLLVLLLIPALLDARREVRDGIRRTEVERYKVSLERFYNQHEFYPLGFDVRPHTYVVEEEAGIEAVSWYIRAQLENTHPEEAGFNDEGTKNYYYRYVVEDGVTYFDICGGTSTCGAPIYEE